MIFCTKWRKYFPDFKEEYAVSGAGKGWLSEAVPVPAALPPEKRDLENLIFQALSEARRKRLAGRQNDELPKPAKWLFSTVSGILSIGKADGMDQRFTPEQLNRMDHKTKDGI